MKFNQLSNEVKVSICIFGAIVLIIGGTIVLGITNNNKLYDAMKKDITNREWINAKTKLETLGNYKDSQSFSNEIYYNYYTLVGDNLNQEKQYLGALSNYKKAYQLNSNDENLVQKIKKIEKILQKLKEEEEKAKKLKQQQEELKRKQEEVAKLKAEKERKIKEQNELYELKKLVNRAFVKTDFLDDGDSSSTSFNFYTYPDNWYQLNYTEQKNVFNSCVRYVELERNISWHHAYRYTKIINVFSNLPMASYTLFE